MENQNFICLFEVIFNLVRSVIVVKFPSKPISFVPNDMVCGGKCD